MSAISILLPTCGRPTLSRAIDSVISQLAFRDEVLVIGDGRQPAAERTVGTLAHSQVRYWEYGPTGFFGNAQRNFAATKATGNLLCFLDDDDLYDPQALAAIRLAACEHPGRPLMFRIRCLDPPWEKWREPLFANENISGGSFVVPNVPHQLGQWPTPDHPLSRWSDRVFIEETLQKWPEGLNSLVWRKELIYHVPRASGNAP